MPVLVPAPSSSLLETTDMPTPASAAIGTEVAVPGQMSSPVAVLLIDCRSPKPQRIDASETYRPSWAWTCPNEFTAHRSRFSPIGQDDDR